jgi:HD-like signal output (HDOD) protein
LSAGEEGANAFRAYMRTHHTQFGVAMMQRWRFDEDFLAVVRYHDDLGSAKAVSGSLLIVHLATLLVRSRGYGEALDTKDALDAAPSRTYLFPGEVDLEEIGGEVDKAVANTLALLA